MKILYFLFIAVMSHSLRAQTPKISVEDSTKAQIEFKRINASGALEQNSLGGALRLQHPSIEDSTLIQFRTYDDSYLNGGKVGIGTASPSARMHVVAPAPGGGTGLAIAGIGIEIGISGSGGIYGVTGDSGGSSGGRGINGTGETGVYGDGDKFGVIGTTSDENGVGGYFSGDVDVELAGSYGTIFSDNAMHLTSNENIEVFLDSDGDGAASFKIFDDALAEIFTVTGGSNVTTGVYVDGLLQHTSDRNRKKGIVDVNVQDILSKIDHLPVYHWQFKGSEEKHIGPMSQDFYHAFEVGGCDRTIATVDADGVAFAAIKALIEVNEKQDTEIVLLKREINTLKKMIAKDKD